MGETNNIVFIPFPPRHRPPCAVPIYSDDNDDYEVWFVMGSQHLYGLEILRQVNQHAAELLPPMRKLNMKETVLQTGAETAGWFTPDENHGFLASLLPHAITTTISRAGNCSGCTLFPRPSRINHLTMLNKPAVNSNSSFNAALPWDGTIWTL